MYAPLNIAAAAPWAIVVGLLNYAFGAVLNRFIGRIQSYEHWLILGIAASAFLLHLALRLRRRT